MACGLENRRPPFTRAKLKELVYGTDRPSLEREMECAVTEARRIIKRIEMVETAFPAGFGLMAQQIRSWAAPRATPSTAKTEGRSS